MTAKRFGGIALVAAGLLVACERWQINGLVVQREPGVGTEEAIGKAIATLSCPDGGGVAIWNTAVSNKTGQFTMFQENTVGPSEDCSVTVAAKGYAARKYPIDHICAKYKDDPRVSASPSADAGTTTEEGLTVPRSSAAATVKKICYEAFVLAEMELVPVDAGHDAGDPDAG